MRWMWKMVAVAVLLSGSPGFASLNTNTTPVTVTNRTDEVNLYSVPVAANALGTGECVSQHVTGTVTWDGLTEVTFRLRYGSGVISLAATPTQRSAVPLRVESYLCGKGTTGSQRAEFYVYAGVTSIVRGSTGAMAVDSTQQQTLSLSVQFGAATTGSTIVKDVARLLSTAASSIPLTHATDCTNGGVTASLYQQCVDLDDGRQWTCKLPATAGDTTVCDAPADWILNSSTSSSGVSTWNSRSGVVVPVAGDYTATQITNTPAGGITETNLQATVNGLDTRLTAKADASALAGKADVSALALKADAGATTAALALKADASTMTTALAGKQPLASTLTTVAGKTPQGTGVDLRLSTGTFTAGNFVTTDANGNFADGGDVATQAELTAGLAAKADASTMTTALAGKQPLASALTAVAGKTLQGTGSDLRFSSGAFATDDCVKVNASGNFVTAGAACGSGSGGSVGTLQQVLTNGSTYTGADSEAHAVSIGNTTEAIKFWCDVTNHCVMKYPATQSLIHQLGVNTSAGWEDHTGADIVLIDEATKTMNFQSGANVKLPVTGYVKCSGTSANCTGSATVPGADIAGDIAGNAASVTGTVPIAKGGTGATTQQAAIDALTNAAGGVPTYVWTLNGSNHGIWAAASGGGGGGSTSACGDLTCVPPVPGEFTGVNMTGATLDTSQTGLLYLRATAASGTAIAYQVHSLPSPPYTVTVVMNPEYYANLNSCGLALLNNASNAAQILWPRQDTNGMKLQISNFAAVNGSEGSALNIPHDIGNTAFLRVTSDGTTRTWSVSNTGAFWVPVLAVAHTNQLTPDRVALACTSYNTTVGAGAVFRHFQIQ